MSRTREYADPGGLAGRVTEIRAALETAASPDRAEPMAAYMRNQFPFIGVQAVSRRRSTRALLPRGSADWPWVHALWEEPEREFQYVACDHLQKAKLTSADLPELRWVITHKSWWDTVDQLPKAIGAFTTPDTMLAWAVDTNLWMRRVAILHQLGRKAATDTAVLKEILENNLGSTEFFINKAVGWALREYSKTDPQWVKAFADSHELSALSRREGLKYIRT